ncbi:MAG TPA: DUF1800 domain-containing protein [Gemmatimonadaceae bacterium]|nr:DUF1800 domain-containing protein [Gemmatimonadaceae bacterium]
MRQFPFPSFILFAALAACAPRAIGTSAASATPSSGNALLTNAPLAVSDRVRQALDRLTFGARPGDVAAVERVGLNEWIDRQLDPAGIPDPVADSVLNSLEITHKTAFELIADHPQANEFDMNFLQSQAKIASMRAPDTTAPMSAVAQLQAMRASVEDATERASLGVRLNQTRSAAARELPTSILLRATISDRQLLEVMTVFWENHFSVSADKMPNPFTLVDYDRAIRTHALGKFRDLLHAVATSPAMLFYLDNYQSAVDSLHPTVIEWRAEQRRAAHPPFGDTALVRTLHRRRAGVNENYARELMELHTLGVDGGYTQRDVQEVARCLTGWTIDNFQFGGTFSFDAARHDAGEKTVLGVRIPGGRGIEDGEQVLDILARHPSTARFIATKLVVHFVSDSPPPALVERVAQVYLHTDGDIREMMRAIVHSPEFNSRGAYRAKVKTPFELVASILRAMNAAPDTTPQSVQLVARLGQPVFGRPTPDGWPDQGAAWMNTGALMNRINLGAQVAANQIRGVSIAGWKPRQPLSAMRAEQQVDGVIDALLAGDGSPEVRRELLAVQSPPQTVQHIAEMASIVIGSSDFQRR